MGFQTLLKNERIHSAKSYVNSNDALGEPFRYMKLKIGKKEIETKRTIETGSKKRNQTKNN